MEKTATFLLASSSTMAGLIWSLMYWSQWGWGLTAALPFGFALIVFLALIISHISTNHSIAIYTQIICFIYFAAVVQWIIGGVFDSGLVLIWSILGPLVSLMFLSGRQSAVWFTLFLLNLLITVIFDDYFILHGLVVAERTKLLFVLMNLGGASTIVFIFAGYFVKTAVKEQEKARKLLGANLQQEIALRQNEKLATLGKLSAGIAHELNNPASASLRGADQLHESLSNLEGAMFKLSMLNLSDEQNFRLVNDLQYGESAIIQPVDFSALSRSDREEEIEYWLEDNHIEDAWALAPTLVRVGYDVQKLASLRELFISSDLGVILSVMGNSFKSRILLTELSMSATQIAQIVKALKSYSYLDRAAIQTINVRDGLNDTLVILRSKLKSGVQIQTEFADNLPVIEAYGSELNQVWTNLIDNSLAAINSEGTIVIRTRATKFGVEVEIEDSGTGIPEDVLPKIFDPFFTTKSPGEGIGLGLNISHDIIVNKHKGTITANSSSNGTRFVVQLPLSLPKIEEAPSHPNVK